jgi:P-type Ca2+ transporter type 2C
MGGFSIANYLLYYPRSGVDPFTGAVPAAILAPAMSISCVTIMVCQLVSIIQRRSVNGLVSRYQFSNRSFWWAIAAAVVIMLVILYVPFVAMFFATAPLSMLDWLYVGLAAAAFLGVREATRMIRGRTSTSQPTTPRAAAPTPGQSRVTE